MSATQGATLLRKAALATTVIAGAASVALQLYAGRQSPQRLVVLLIAAWVLSPFVLLLLLNLRAGRWPAGPQRALRYISLFVSATSLLLYAVGTTRPLVSRPAAFLFVAVPPASLLAAAVVLGTTLLVSRRVGRPDNP